MLGGRGRGFPIPSASSRVHPVHHRLRAVELGGAVGEDELPEQHPCLRRARTTTTTTNNNNNNNNNSSSSNSNNDNNNNNNNNISNKYSNSGNNDTYNNTSNNNNNNSVRACDAMVSPKSFEVGDLNW